MLETEAVQDPDFFGPLEYPDISTLVTGFLKGGGRFGKGNALLADNALDMVAENGDLRKFLFGAVAGDRSQCEDGQNR